MKIFEISSMAIMMIVGADAAHHYSHYSTGSPSYHSYSDSQKYENNYNLLTGTYSYKPLSPYNRQLAINGYVNLDKPSKDSPYGNVKDFNTRYVPPPQIFSSAHLDSAYHQKMKAYDIQS